MALGDDAYNRLKDNIRNGHYSPGQKLSLSSLAKEFGMSITPVRDGLSRLVAEKILVALPNRKVCVPVPSIESIVEVRTVKRELEGLAAYHAGRNITRSELEELAECHKHFLDARSKGDPKEMQRTNTAFHFGIYSAARMPLLLETIETYWIRDAPMQYLLYTQQTDVVNKANRHQQIIDSLWNRDPDLARKEVMADIGDVTDTIMSLAAKLTRLDN